MCQKLIADIAAAQSLLQFQRASWQVVEQQKQLLLKFLEIAEVVGLTQEVQAAKAVLAQLTIVSDHQCDHN